MSDCPTRIVQTERVPGVCSDRPCFAASSRIAIGYLHAQYQP